MILSFAHEIEHNPAPEAVGTVQINVDRTKIYQSSIDWDEELVETSSIQFSLPEYIDGWITEFLIGSGEITPVDAYDALQDLLRLVGEVTSSDDYTPDCALTVWMTLTIVFPSDQTEEAAPSDQLQQVFRVSLNDTFEEDVQSLDDIVFEFDHQIEEEAAPSDQLTAVFRVSLNDTTEEEVTDTEEDEHDTFFEFDHQTEGAAPSQSQPRRVFRFYDLIHEVDEDNVSFDHFDHQTEEAARSQIEEVFRASFNEANAVTRLRPASKHAVESLKKKIYNKTSDVVGDEIDDRCTICLEEFNDGTSIVTLPCGHEFDEECIGEWFASSHVCPLCRFKLPCER